MTTRNVSPPRPSPSVSDEVKAKVKELGLFEKLKEKAIQLCDMPRLSLSASLNAQKRAQEIRFTQSLSKLTFMACAVLTNSVSRATKQELLEIEDLVTRMKRVIELLEVEIEVKRFMSDNH